MVRDAPHLRARIGLRTFRAVSSENNKITINVTNPARRLRVVDAIDRATDQSAQKRSKISSSLRSVCMRKSRYREFGRPNKFCQSALEFSLAVQNLFFNVDSIDFDASIDRGTQKRSKILSGLRYVCVRKSTHRDFRGQNKFLPERRQFRLCRPKSNFQCDSIDFDASIDRGTQKRSKFPSNLRYVCVLRKSTHRDFREPNKFCRSAVDFSVF